MTRSQLIETLAVACRLDRPTAERAVQAVFQSMSSALARGDGIELRGLGSFTVRTYAAYRGRNPRNGLAVEVKQKRLPHFKVGKPMKQRVAGGENVAKRSARG